MNNDNKDSVNSINELFGTNISNNKSKIVDDKKYQDIPNINKVVEKNEVKEEPSKEEVPVENKFINEEYINNTEEKKEEIKEDSSNDNELVYIIKHFDPSKIKFNLSIIGLIITMIGAILYNVFIVVPGFILSFIGYKNVKSGKYDRQDLLFTLGAMILGVLSLIIIVVEKVMGIINFGL